MRRNRASDGRLAAATCAMGTLTVNINNTAINLALPAIRDELRLDLVEMQWVSASYVLILAALTMIGGTLGDRFDKRQVLTVGLCLYTTGSLLGALSLSALTLIGSRILAGIGAAVLVPVGLASLRQLASSPQQLTSYMSLWGLAVGLGMALGPVVGGGLTGYLGWRALFVAMTAFGVIYLFAVRICLPRLDSFERAGVSIVSHMLAAISMVSAAGLVIEMRSDSPWLLKASLAFALPVCGTLWIHRDRTTSHPVIPPCAWRNPNYAAALAIGFTNYVALGATVFLSSLFLQDAAQLPAAVAGFGCVPLAAATAWGATWAGAHEMPDAARRVVQVAAMLLGCGLTVAGAGVVFQTVSDSPAVAIFTYVVGTSLMGFGFGAANAPVNVMAMSSLPKRQSGVAGSSASTARQLGQSLGVAAGGLLLSLADSPGGSTSPQSYVLPSLSIFMCAVVLMFLPLRFSRHS